MAISRTPLPKPRFTIGLLYLFGFFFLYCFALVTPALWEVLRTLPPGPEQQSAAAQAAQQAVQPRLPIALAAAILTTAIGIWKRLLPGAR
jgi:hypothetical protein